MMLWRVSSSFCNKFTALGVFFPYVSLHVTCMGLTMHSAWMHEDAHQWIDVLARNENSCATCLQ